MNLAQDIQSCLRSRGWTPAVLAREAGVKSVQAITRVLKGEREGMHSKNLLKLAPFLYGSNSPTDSRPDAQRTE
jgi:transcriptional regulator with XRE-family HTH domain